MLPWQFCTHPGGGPRDYGKWEPAPSGPKTLSLSPLHSLDSTGLSG